MFTEQSIFRDSHIGPTAKYTQPNVERPFGLNGPAKQPLMVKTCFFDNDDKDNQKAKTQPPQQNHQTENRTQT